MKKVIRVAPELFIYEVKTDRVVTVKHIKKAKDISDWNFAQLKYVMENLKQKGYNPKVLEVKA